MTKLNAIKTDLKKEIDGVWRNYEGIKLLIARARNSVYLELLNKLREPYEESIRNETITEDQLVDIVKQARSQAILLDWNSLEDNDGNEISYSREKALEFFRDPELKDFYQFVVLCSETSENYRKRLVEDSEKN